MESIHWTAMTNIELDREIAEVEEQERRLQFTAFSNQDALDLGLGLVTLAKAAGKAVVIDIDRAGHCLFHHAMTGTTPDLDQWIRRKRNTMRLVGTSSLLVFLHLAREGIDMSRKYGVVDSEHAPGGGGFPIRVAGSGIIGHVVVSGLPHKEDHALVVAAMTRHLG